MKNYISFVIFPVIFICLAFVIDALDNLLNLLNKKVEYKICGTFLICLICHCHIFGLIDVSRFYFE